MRHHKNIVTECLATLFLASIIMAIVVPLLFFITAALSSSQEIYSFPKKLLPKLSYNLMVEWDSSENAYSLYAENQKGSYEQLMISNRSREISHYLAKQFSVIRTSQQVSEDFEVAREQGQPIYLNYRKDLLYNFRTFFSVVNHASTGLKNSLIAAFWTILISVSLGSMAGYGMARYNFKGKEELGLVTLIVRMFPVVAISVPMVVYLIRMNLSDNMFGLAIVYSIPNIGLSAWITRSIFLGINVEQEEASLVFGASRFKTFMKITLPIALPGIVTASMYSFLAAWNDSITALILSNNNPTLSLAIYKSLGSADIQLAAAGAIILIIPALIFTYIIKGRLNQLWGNVKV